ncbi:Helicase associated domain protein [Nonomuraea jabiensis]|uniref:helicase associated domain-containing protein n=1 Tax=Nonomuraea jabiensis TaxID=882448 RepID=UPI003D730518
MATPAVPSDPSALPSSDSGLTIERTGGDRQHRQVSTLWPHQREAVEAACRTLAEGGRATQVLSCGTGKTRIGAHVAVRLAARGRRLILAPTVMLLAQMLREYRLAVGDAALGRVLVVCSDSGAAQRAGLEELHALRVQVTTDSAIIAGVASSTGPVTVLSTYASLPAICEAHRLNRLPRWHLVIADEAHRTVLGQEWGRIHDDDQIPAERRLYMTATPRQLVGKRGELDVVGMEDESVYGPTISRLKYCTARNLGLSADYRLVVSAITDAQLRALTDQTRGRAGLQVRGKRIPARMLAAQIALLRAAAQYGLRRVITYHTTTDDARHFAATLPDIATLLPAPLRPAALWADHVRYTQSADARYHRLERLAAGVDDGLAVLANARLLAEGTDVPAVDAIMFVDRRRSVIDIIQAIGRAVRLDGRTDKIASIIVPLLADPGADPAAAMESSDFAAVWEVVRALRSHDEDLAADLDRRRRDRARRDHEPRPIRWLHVDGADVPEAFVRAVSVGVVESASASWQEYYGAACSYAASQGDLLIPLEWLSETGLRVGVWLRKQRWLYACGALASERVALLEAIGMVWAPRQSAWERNYAAAATYHARHGHLDVPPEHIEDGVRLGQWIKNLRRRADRLTAAQRQLLDDLGMSWKPREDALRRMSWAH